MDESQQCLRCGRAAWFNEGTCAGCGTTLAVDLWLLSPPRDAKVRYELAKKLAALGPLGVDLNAQLKSKRPLLASDVTRARAAEVGQLLAAERLEFELVPRAASMSTAEPSPSLLSRLLKPVATVLVLGALGGGGWWVWKEKGEAVKALVPAMPSLPTPSVAGELPLSEAVKSVVSVRCANSVGSGFFVAPHIVVTNHHVLCAKDAAPEVVFSSGRVAVTEVLKRDAKHDLAVLRIAGPAAEPLELADAASAELGSQVAIIGSPKGLEFSVHRGNLSFIGRATGGVGYLQIDSAINPGNSGGPVLDAHGRVIGVVTARMVESEGIGFAVPINYLVAGDPPLWPIAHQIVTDAWKAFDERTRDSEGPPLTSKSPQPAASAAPSLGKFEVLLASAAWSKFGRGTPEAQVVVVTTDEKAEDRRWRFELKYFDETLCDLLRVQTLAWVRLESTDPRLSAQQSKELVDLKLDRQLYVGVMLVQPGSCPAASAHEAGELALELPGAPAPYNRAVFGGGSRRR